MSAYHTKPTMCLARPSIWESGNRAIAQMQPHEYRESRRAGLGLYYYCIYCLEMVGPHDGTKPHTMEEAT